MSIRTEQEFPSGQWLQAGVQETQFTMALGGPNTGKTRRVIERVAFLLQRGEFPPRITCLTVRDESAERLRQRLRSHPGIRDHLEQMFVGTMTQCANTFLRRSGHRVLGIQPDYNVWSEVDAVAILELILPEKLGSKPARGVIWDALHWHWRNQQRWPDDRPESPRERLWRDIVEVYTDEKRRTNCFDLHDLPVLALQALERDRDVKIAWNGGRFGHIMLDQGEEATRRQLALLTRMVGPKSFLMVTGDPNQAVHPEGDPSGLQYLLEAYSPHVYTLGSSHGNNTGLNRLAAALARQLGVPGMPEDGPGQDRLVGETPRLVTVEGHFLDMDIRCLEDAKTLHGQGVEWEDMAVLDRRGRAVDRMRTQLAHRDIPFRVLGEAPPDRPTDARCLAALLASALTPADPQAVRLAAAPGYPNKNRILPAEISLRLRAVAQQQKLDLIMAANSLLEAGEVQGQDLTPLLCLTGAMFLLDKYLSGELESLVDLCIFLKGAVDKAKGKGRMEPGDIDMTHLLELCRSNPQQRGESRRVHLRRVLDLWSPALHPGRQYERQGGITFSSIHAAKGRTWPVVFVLDASDQSIPGGVGPYSSRLELEQRLLYIAITRASHRLYLYCLADTGMAGARYIPSRFLDCAGKLLERQLAPYRPPESSPDPFADPFADPRRTWARGSREKSADLRIIPQE